MMIKLTKYDNEGYVWIDPESVYLIEEHPMDSGCDDGIELGDRTKVQTRGGDLVIVTESGQQVHDMIQGEALKKALDRKSP